MFNKKMLAASMAVAMTTGGFVAQSHAMVGVTNNDVGQVLLGPIYYAANGFTTDITVTNIRTDAAVKAKVVFRSNKESQEVLDFLIYLSPGDVWRGQVSETSDGSGGQISSSDDSMRNADDSDWANNDPVTQAFFNQALDSDDGSKFGHFEVIGVYAAAGAYTVGTTTVTVQQGMTKDALKSIFDAADAGTIGRNPDYMDCTPSTINDTGVDPQGTVSSIAPCSLQIMGETIVGNSSSPNRSSQRLTALGTSNGMAGVADEAAAEAAGYVITNPNFQATTAAESLIGTNFGVVGNTYGADNLLAIEMGLAGAQTSYEYESDSDESTHTVMTFPTKYRHANQDGTACGVGSATSGEYTPPFQPTTTGEMEYTYTSLNNSEQGATAAGSSFSGGPTSVAANFPNEVNYHSNMTNFAESGWAYYSWQPETGCTYMGAPVIGYSFKFRPGTTSTETMMQKAPNSTL